MDKEKRPKNANDQRNVPLEGKREAGVRAHDAASPLSIRLFGAFEVRRSGQPLPPLKFRKSRTIFALLALRHGCEVERDWLAGLLWPEAAQAPALHNLRNCLTDLRQALGPEAGRLRSPTPRTLALDLTGVSVDVLAFDAALARADPDSLEAAVTLYRGPLLEGCVEEWAFVERQGREQAYLTALETLAALALATISTPAVSSRSILTPASSSGDSPSRPTTHTTGMPLKPSSRSTPTSTASPARCSCKALATGTSLFWIALLARAFSLHRSVRSTGRWASTQTAAPFRILPRIPRRMVASSPPMRAA